MDLKFVFRMTKGRLSHYFKEIRDQKLANQIFGPMYTLRKSFEVCIYFSSHAFILHH